jgi:hypothetical protein
VLQQRGADAHQISRGARIRQWQQDPRRQRSPTGARVLLGDGGHPLVPAVLRSERDSE